MYMYGILLVLTAGISAMEQPNEGKQELSSAFHLQAVSFSSVKKALFPKKGSPEERHFAAVCAAHLFSLKNKDFDAWAQFGASWGVPARGMTELMIISTETNYFHEPLARARDNRAIFRDALRGTHLFIGTGFGPGVECIGSLPHDIEASFTDAHIPKISRDGEYALFFGKDKGIYLIKIDTFFTGKELSPIQGTEDWKSSLCDFSFTDDSTIVVYNGTAVFMGSAEEVSQHGVSKLSKIIECGSLDRDIYTQYSSVLHVFGGGGLLAFRNQKGPLATIYTIVDGKAEFLTKIQSSAKNYLSGIHTAFDAMSLVFTYLEPDARPDIIVFDSNLEFKTLHPKSLTRNVLYSPDGEYIGFFSPETSILELSTVLNGKFESKSISFFDQAPDSLRWDAILPKFRRYLLGSSFAITREI